jgi:hypothetical protein
MNASARIEESRFGGFEEFADDEFVDPATEARDYENGSFDGASRCPRHPEQKTSSDDGVFDCDCSKCEAEAEADFQAWQVSPENLSRTVCRAWDGCSLPWTRVATCQDVEDDLPF